MRKVKGRGFKLGWSSGSGWAGANREDCPELTGQSASFPDESVVADCGCWNPPSAIRERHRICTSGPKRPLGRRSGLAPTGRTFGSLDESMLCFAILSVTPAPRKKRVAMGSVREIHVLPRCWCWSVGVLENVSPTLLGNNLPLRISKRGSIKQTPMPGAAWMPGIFAAVDE